MVGGPLSSPTGALLTVLGPPARRVSVAWVELYRLGPAPRTPWKRAVARTLMRRYARFAVPGEEGILTVERDGYGRREQCLLLPNLVDESRFGAAAEPSAERTARLQAHLGLRPGRRVALWPARLIEVKGIVPFLERLSPGVLRDWDVVIIGDGPLRRAVDDAIGRHGLAGAVRVVPVVKYEEMPYVYRLADLLVLPSLFDQNPLSVVEAMWAGLPLLLSARVGNFPEALEEGRNGWGFDPTVASETEEAVLRALGTPSKRLREMGAASRDLASERWATEAAVSRFMNSLFSEAARR